MYRINGCTRSRRHDFVAKLRFQSLRPFLCFFLLFVSFVSRLFEGMGEGATEDMPASVSREEL